jgi:hypothetical protein
MINITQDELNKLYCQVNDLHKKGRVSNTSDVVFTSASKQQILFRFDESMKTPSKPEGTWVVKSKLNVKFQDDDEQPSTSNQNL